MMPGMDPRQMAMMMRRMGVEMKDIPAVEEVVVHTKTHTYTFAQATVSVMKAQGTETWQIQGKPRVSERRPKSVGSPMATERAGGGAAGGSSEVPRGRAESGNEQDEREDASTENRPPYTPTEEDVATVAGAAHVDAKTARQALMKTGGDLAQAIVDLGG